MNKKTFLSLAFTFLLIGCSNSSITEEEAQNETIYFFETYAENASTIQDFMVSGASTNLTINAPLNTGAYADYQFTEFTYNEKNRSFKIAGSLTCQSMTGNFDIYWIYDKKSRDWKIETVTLSGCETSIEHMSDTARIAYLNTLSIVLEFYVSDYGQYPSISSGTCVDPDSDNFDFIHTYASSADFTRYGNENLSDLLCNGYPLYLSYNDGKDYALAIHLFEPATINESESSNILCNIDESTIMNAQSLDEFNTDIIDTNVCENGDAAFYILRHSGEQKSMSEDEKTPLPQGMIDRTDEPYFSFNSTVIENAPVSYLLKQYTTLLWVYVCPTDYYADCYFDYQDLTGNSITPENAKDQLAYSAGGILWEATLTPNEDAVIYADVDYTASNTALKIYNFQTKTEKELMSFYPDTEFNFFGWSPDKNRLGLVAYNSNATDYPEGTKLFILQIENGTITKKDKYNVGIAAPSQGNGWYNFYARWIDNNTIEYIAKSLWQESSWYDGTFEEIAHDFPQHLKTYTLQ